MELQNAIESRRSTREFTERKLTKAEISEILRAGILAPSACNMQSWYFYIVCDEREREKLKEVCADWVSAAPVVIIVCTDDNGIVSRFGERGKKFPMQDTSLAMENMLLKATDMGLGGCIIGAYKQDRLNELFNIPHEHTAVALLPIGEPKEKIPPRDRKEIGEVSSYIGEEPEEGEIKPKPFELKHAYLPNTEFSDIGLPNALFDGANLSETKFNNVNLSKAEYSDINLSGASYSAVNMTGSEFKCVELNGAKFGCCEICESEGKYCVEMKESLFDSVDINGSKLNHCSLESSVLTDVKMAGAKLYDIDLDEADLSGVNMVSSNIRCTNLFGATLKNCCLINAALEGCDIEGMTVDGVDVAEAIKAFKDRAK